jgi:hypothetical protein
VLLKNIISIGLLLCSVLVAYSQEKATVKGSIFDDNGFPLGNANILIEGTANGTVSTPTGTFTIQIPANEDVTLVTTFVGFDTIRYSVNLQPNEVHSHSFKMQFSSESIGQVTITDERTRQTTMVKIDPKSLDQLPSPNASLEKTLLFQGLGVTSNNELSSQYNVRGGNYDENLIYVNDVAVYRPFLVRSGQQEGLSFINPKMVSNVNFSSGGFESKYGDKMSSVLDVQYKEPTRRFGGSAEVSLLGANVHLENASKNYRFTQIHGFRYRTNQYLLNSLETQGDYQPEFLDYQSYLTYDITTNWEINGFVNYAKNTYRFVPENRTTEFGTINEALQLNVFFEGQEINAYETFVGAIGSTHNPTDELQLKFIASGTRSVEEERFDVEGAYRLSELDRDLGSDNFGNPLTTRGIGGFLNHARNFLDVYIGSFEHKGTYYGKGYTVDWGAKGQYELIEDEFSEWQNIDSSGFSIPQQQPFSPRPTIDLYDVVKSDNEIESNRFTGYGQFRKTLSIDSNEIAFNVGARANYWSFNEQLVGGPRASISWKPNWKRNFLFKAAWGYYHQPPFYREMRNLQGEINPNIKAQTSIHYVLGMDYVFNIWNRPFKLQAEAYYKQLNNLIPYEIDNVRIRYYAENNANGYATGLDLKLNGEFVPGVESWISMSVMGTAEDIEDDFYYKYYDSDGNPTYVGNIARPPADSQRVTPGNIPRPTDQRVNFSLFFQDYLPNDPTTKMNLNIVFGTGLPFGPPSYNRYQDTLRIPPYRRVDIGLSKQLLRPEKNKRKQLGTAKAFRHIDNIWLNVEVFNLLAINNTISYLWIRDISNRQYAIPNYLTSRQVNVRLIVDF